jgi:predicted DNA-binding mobile mystery protein A
MKNQWLTIRQLDGQLKEWQKLGSKYGRPRAGWIKTLRTALSMSVEQLGERLGLSRGRIHQLENAETHEAVTLRSLNEAANALGCELIYAVVPKGTSSLEDIIRMRAEEIAKERIANVAHSMSLESQAVNKNALLIQKEELTEHLMEHLNKKFWSTSNKNHLLDLAEHLKKKK